MPHTRHLTIGTLSFVRCKQKNVITPVERRRLILAAARHHRPDLLITAGHALDSRKDLRWLTREYFKLGGAGAIVTEVEHDAPTSHRYVDTHAMYAISGDGDVHRFGEQMFTQAKDTWGDGEARVARLVKRLPRRTTELGGRNVFAMPCGEINIVQGREEPRFVSPEAERAIMAADVVINPTHDRMSNAGTLDAKRRLLSRAHPDDQPRLYVSCSNWEAYDIGGRKQAPSPTLHTVYRSGEPCEYEEIADGAFGFVYRRWDLTC